MLKGTSKNSIKARGQGGNARKSGVYTQYMSILSAPLYIMATQPLRLQRIFRGALKSRYTILFLCLLSTNAAFATQPTPSLYIGQEQRGIKALSSDEIKSYLAGKGAGFAKAAELNHYPGPAHVLELSQQLQLSPEQHARTQQQFNFMQAEAMRLGKALVGQEQLLDTLFATGSISKDALRSTLENLATLQAQIRQVHLEAHLGQKNILTPDQVRRYDALRGYNKPVNAKAEGGAQHHIH